MCFFFFFVYRYIFLPRGAFFFSSRRRHTRFSRDWSSDVCSSDLANAVVVAEPVHCERDAPEGDETDRESEPLEAGAGEQRGTEKGEREDHELDPRERGEPCERHEGELVLSRGLRERADAGVDGGEHERVGDRLADDIRDVEEGGSHEGERGSG